VYFVACAVFALVVQLTTPVAVVEAHLAQIEVKATDAPYARAYVHDPKLAGFVFIALHVALLFELPRMVVLRPELRYICLLFIVYPF